MLNAEELSNFAILVFSNKQDLPNAMKPNEISEKLGLHTLRQRKWYCQGARATNAEGL